jgi:hypothetical protein
MTSKTGFSAFLDHYLAYSTKRQITVVEYNRHGGVYSHFSGRLDGSINHTFVAYREMLEFRLHLSENYGWNGFPVPYELRRFNLTVEYDDTTFETIGDGTIGVLHGFCRAARYPVDIFVSGGVYAFD